MFSILKIIFIWCNIVLNFSSGVFLNNKGYYFGMCEWYGGYDIILVKVELI